MTCGWLISNYAKLRRHVEKRRNRRGELEEWKKAGEEATCEYRFGFRCLSRRKVSTRLEITINLRSRLRHSKLICFESINKKLNVTWIADYMPYASLRFLPFNRIIERYETSGYTFQRNRLNFSKTWIHTRMITQFLWETALILQLVTSFSKNTLKIFFLLFIYS